MARSVAILLAGILATVVPAADACPCEPQRPACEEYWKAAAIFRGRADAVQRSPTGAGEATSSRLVTFSVLEGLKGIDAPATIQVWTADNRSACGFGFVAGREYVVYAWADAAGDLRTGRCTRTQPVAGAQADLAFARRIASGTPGPGQIRGLVLLRSRDLASARDRDRPMAKVGVMLERDDFSVTVLTDAAGRFAADGLEAGLYTATLDLQGEFRTTMLPARIGLPDARACADVRAVVQPNGRVFGRVVDNARRPIRGLTVDLTVRDGSSPGREPERLRAVTRGDGTYEFTGVPPGRFVVGINTRGADAGGFPPPPRAYHPGVLSVADAALITVAPGGRAEAGDFVMPDSIGFVQIVGVVVDGTGSPAEGARVYLRGPAERDRILGEPVIADFIGRFELAAPIEGSYRLFAERVRPGDTRGRLDASDSVLFTPSSGGPVPRLILKRR